MTWEWVLRILYWNHSYVSICVIFIKCWPVKVKVQLRYGLVSTTTVNPENKAICLVIMSALYNLDLLLYNCSYTTTLCVRWLFVDQSCLCQYVVTNGRNLPHTCDSSSSLSTWVSCFVYTPFNHSTKFACIWMNL